MTYWVKVAVAVVLVLAAAQLVLAVGNILVLLLVSLVLALGFQPAVEWLERRGLARGWAVTLGLFAGLIVIGLFLWLVLPDVIAEIADLVRAVPGYLARVEQEGGFLADVIQRFDLEQRVQDLGAELPGTALGIITSFTTFVFNALTVMILTILFTLHLPRMRAGVARLLRPAEREKWREILEKSTRQVGGYVLGQLVVISIAGALAFIALLIIGVPFAAALAFFVALTDLIPTIGAIIGAVVASVVAAFAGIPELIATAAYFTVYQQVENYFIQPRVMGRAINMSAAVVIIAVLIGGSLLGVVGAVLAIPIAAIVKVVLQELYVEERLEEVREEERRLSSEGRARAPSTRS